MKFGIFYEHQLPRPWNEDSEQNLFQEALDQVEPDPPRVAIPSGEPKTHV